MKSKIAVLLDTKNQLTDLFNTHSIAIYEKNENWQVVQSIYLEENSVNLQKDVRGLVQHLMGELKCCKLIVGKLINGLPYYLLSKEGYELFEAEELSTMLLDQIYADYVTNNEKKQEAMEKDLKKTNKEEVPKKPVPINHEGDYFLDLMALQKAYPEISSKKALLPFFSHEFYKSITIVCSHVMPWLEGFMEQHHLEAKINRETGSYKLIISHKLCN